MHCKCFASNLSSSCIVQLHTDWLKRPIVERSLQSIQLRTSTHEQSSKSLWPRACIVKPACTRCTLTTGDVCAPQRTNNPASACDHALALWSLHAPVRALSTRDVCTRCHTNNKQAHESARFDDVVKSAFYCIACLISCHKNDNATITINDQFWEYIYICWQLFDCYWQIEFISHLVQM